MITRLYVDNFRCMVDFEYRPGSLQLLFGENGSGKSTVFEVLWTLRDFICRGREAGSAFPSTTLPAWGATGPQVFEIDLQSSYGVYRYRLEIGPGGALIGPIVRQEVLRFEDKELFIFDGTNARVFTDGNPVGLPFIQSQTRSGVGLMLDRPDMSHLSWFRRRMSQILLFHIDPIGMKDVSDAEEQGPDHTMANFPSWYRSLMQEFPERIGLLHESLDEVIDGFSWLKLVPIGEGSRILTIGFKRMVEESWESEFSLPFSSLSHGHKCLIALFSLLHFGTGPNTTVCIDEPDNFVALRELQPWLTAMCDRVEETKGQCLLISHHPEFIDLLAVRQGVRFEKAPSGIVTAAPVEWSDGDVIRPSEIVARGWEA